MRPPSKRSKILIIAIGVLLVLSFNFFQKEVKGFFYFISSPIQKALWWTGDNVSDFFETMTNLKNLKKENEELKLSLQALLAENTSLKEFQKENEVLREALEIGLSKDFRLSLAEVISQDIGQDALLINQGAKDGLLRGMPVVTQEQVLLGKITEVYDKFSRLTLISNKESSFDAEIPDKEIVGVIKGKGRLKIQLDLISQDQAVKEGDLVVSTSFGGIYPQGLLVGLIKEIKKSDIKPFYEIEVAPFFDIKKIKSVLIILDF